jgi:signal peptidase I
MKLWKPSTIRSSQNSPLISDPVAIFKSLVLRQHEDSWSYQLPFIHGRLFGSLP